MRRNSAGAPEASSVAGNASRCRGTKKRFQGTNGGYMGDTVHKLYQTIVKPCKLVNPIFFERLTFVNMHSWLYLPVWIQICHMQDNDIACHPKQCFTTPPVEAVRCKYDISCNTTGFWNQLATIGVQYDLINKLTKLGNQPQLMPATC